MYEAKYAVCTEGGAQTLATEPLLAGKAAGLAPISVTIAALRELYSLPVCH